jgi:DNA-binding response OmpR family regulator
MSQVLIVDDERSVRNVMRRFLEADGHEVSVAEHGEDAFKLITENRFDLVVTDIFMPKVDGVDLLKRIKQVSPQVPVILVSGNPTLDTAIKAVKLGASDYMVKPFTESEFLSSVHRVAMAADPSTSHLGAGRNNSSQREHGGPSNRDDSANEISNVRICIIDDEDQVVSIVERALQAKGYETLGITDVIGCTTRVREFSPHIIVLDLKMATLEGDRLLQVLRQVLDYDPKVIVFSGIEPKELERMALKMNVDDYVYKGDGYFRLLGRVNLHVYELSMCGKI